MSEQFEMIAKTFQGLEEILAEELTALGANDIQIGRRMVSFTYRHPYPETHQELYGQRC